MQPWLSDLLSGALQGSDHLSSPTGRHLACILSLLVLAVGLLDVGPVDRELLATAGGALVALWPLPSLAVSWALRRGRSPLVPFFAGLSACLGLCVLLPENRTARLLLLPGLLAPDECGRIVAAAEAHGGWSSDRHGNLSTEDIPLRRLAPLNESLPALLAARLLPITRKHLQATLVPQDVFVVRYTMGHQLALRPHFDGGQVTYSVALSDPGEFAGGGVRFPLLPPEAAATADPTDRQPEGRVLRLALGDGLVQPAKLRHEGVRLEGGRRYLLISFNELRFDSWLARLRGLLNLRGLLARRAELHVVPRSDAPLHPAR